VTVTELRPLGTAGAIRFARRNLRMCAEVEDAGCYGRIELDRSGRIARFVEKDPGIQLEGILASFRINWGWAARAIGVE
jgi:hypothetical protein